MKYQGKERRQRRMYVTRNTEYHFQGDVCVAVRDRSKGTWLLSHQALDRQLSGAIRFRDGGDAYPTLEEPGVGDALFFGSKGPDVITSLVAAIERPSREQVEAYPL
ncbi:MAG TPA: hypothetical protein VHM70_04145 [Polyangiaceae bacterium]|nr:hypothetical protein [Polyangiaceae bacterium]